MLIRTTYLLFFLFILQSTTPALAQVSTNGDSTKASIPKAQGSLDKPIDYKADDSIIFDIKKNKVYLFRKAELNYGDIHLTAHYIEIDLTKKEIFAKGGPDSNGKYSNLPILKDGEDSYKADSMRYNSNSKKGRVYGLRLVQEDAYIHLNKVLKQEDGSFVGQRGKITTCSEDHPHFYFNASKIKVIPNNKVLFGSANLVVEDVPTPLAVPFGLAPLKKGRRNGLLFPAYGYNYANKSFYLQKLGYYTGLGPHADLSVWTDAYLNGDLRLGASSNLIKLYKYKGGIQISASRFSNGAEVTSPKYSHNLDYSLISNFSFDPKYLPGTTLNGDIHVQTSNFNRLNSRDLTSIVQNQYNSSINFGRSFLNHKLNLAASARHSQNTQTHDFRLELPNVVLSMPRITPFAGKTGGSKWYQQIGVSYSMNFSNVLNTKDTTLFSKNWKDPFKDLQNGIKHSITTSTTVKALSGTVNISPSVNYNETWYFRSVHKEWDTAHHKTATTYTDHFYRIQQYSIGTSISTNVYGTFQNMHIGKLRALRHTITPSLSVNYSPEINPQKLGWIRGYFNDTLKANNLQKYNMFEKGIYGAPSQVESGSIGFNLNNNLQAKKVSGVDSNGKEKLDKVNIIDALSASGNYNLLADSLNLSDISLAMNTVLLKLFNINSTAQYSPYALNSSGRKYNKFMFEKDHTAPLRFVSFHTSINTKLTPDNFKKKKPVSTAATSTHKQTDAEVEDVKRNEEKYYNFNIPWSLNLTYIIDVNNENKKLTPGIKSITTHRIGFGGDLNLTSEWKIGFNSGYDLVQKKLSSSQFNVSRNLHCWQLDFSWVPNQWWVFTLRPKSQLLQDLKLNKRVYKNPALFGAY